MPTKIALVTGAYGGLGSELCKMIAAQGTSLILVDRDFQKSKAFAATIKSQYPAINVHAFAVDLANHADIKRLTAEVLAQYQTIDYLFNNAGVLTESLQFSDYNNELHFEVNTLAPLQIIDQLRPALKNAQGAVVVSTSAGLAMNAKQLDWDTLLKPVAFKKLFGAYVNSKQALNVVTAGLAPELVADGIFVRTADPGPNKTKLTKGKGTPLWMRLFYGLLPGPEQGAKRIFDTAMSAKWAGKTGIFVTGGKIQTLPPALTDTQFQREFLQKCRERAAVLSS